MVGNLLYTSSSKTRPDICTQLVSRFVEGYSQERINDIKHILKYLNGNVDRNKVQEEQKYQFTWSIFRCILRLCDLKTRRSTTGYIIFFAGGPTNWCSRKQSILA